MKAKIMVQLEKYHGTKSRHTCPSCNSRNCFVRYVDENGEYISDDCGRCNRESKCGYEYKPKQFFADNPSLKSAKTKKRGTPNYAFVVKNGSTVEYKAKAIAVKPDYIPFEQFKKTLGNYDRNAFVQFLFDLFPDCSEEIQAVLKMYLVGTFDDYTCFPSIDRLNRICRAKLIKFNPATGKRLKGDFDTSSLVRKLKLKEDFNYKQIFFGEHLLRGETVKPVAVVESEKTAIIASLCMPQFVWLATGSKQWLKVERLQRLDNRQIILYPDADGFDQWQAVATDAQRQGLNVKASRLIENFATDQQKRNQYDLADYLINQQTEINEINEFIDSYNFAVDKTQACAVLPHELKTILEETISIIEINGNLSRIEAETIAYTPDYLRSVVMSI
jgi:transcription elongation factor Elf1